MSDRRRKICGGRGKEKRREGEGGTGHGERKKIRKRDGGWLRKGRMGEHRELDGGRENEGN